MSFNLIRELGIPVESQSAVFDTMGSCRSLGEALKKLDKNHEMLCSVIESLPAQMSDTNTEALFGVISLVTTHDRQIWSSDAVSRVKDAERFLDLRGDIAQVFETFKDAKIPSLHKLRYDLKSCALEAVIGGLPTYSVDQSLSVAEGLIGKAAKAQHMNIALNRQEVLTDLVKMSFEWAHAEDPAQRLKAKQLMDGLQGGVPPEENALLKSLVKDRFKYAVNELEHKAEAMLPKNAETLVDWQTEAARLLEFGAALAPDVQDELQLPGLMHQVLQVSATTFLKDFDLLHQKVKAGQNITGAEVETLAKLNVSLAALLKAAPEKWGGDEIEKQTRQQVFERVLGFSDKVIEGILHAEHYPQVQKCVVAVLPHLKAYLDNNNSGMEEFLHAFEKAGELLDPVQHEIKQADHGDLILPAYLACARSLTENAAFCFKNRMKQRSLDLSSPAQKMEQDRLENILKKYPPMLGMEIGLKIEMKVEHDKLIAMLFGELSKHVDDDNLYGNIVAWVRSHPDYDYELFQDWLAFKIEDQIPLGVLGDCEMVYAQFVAEML